MSGLRFGVGQHVITPPVGVSLAGYFHDRVGESVRDDLHAKALVMESGGERFALVACDLICIDRAVASPAKQIISDEVGIAPENVMIAATHTHTGPEVRRGRVVKVDEGWLGNLPRRIADAVKDAASKVSDGEVFPNRGEEPDLAHNRLFRLKDGTESFGFRDRDQVAGAAGPIDPELLVAKFVDAKGRVRALMVNYALHVDVIGGGKANFISADWPGELAKAVAAIYGEDCVTLFVNGCCGDINQHPYLEPSALSCRGPEGAVRLGRAFGCLAVNVAEKAEPMEDATLAARLEVLDIPYYEVDDKMRAYIAELKKKEELTTAEKFTVERVESWDLGGKSEAVPVQAARAGEMAFVGLPGEIFCRWGLEIKKWSPAEFTFVVELANHWVGYVPTIEQAVRGGYGAMPVLSRRLTTDAGQRMTDAAFVMLQDLW